jgi:hypothetical protein
MDMRHVGRTYLLILRATIAITPTAVQEGRAAEWCKAQCLRRTRDVVPSNNISAHQGLRTHGVIEENVLIFMQLYSNAVLVPFFPIDQFSASSRRPRPAIEDYDDE